jgi:hypothetical protein
MPLRFEDSPRPEVFQILTFPVDAPTHVQIGSQASFRLTHAVHWLPSQNQAVPCLHEDCPWCPLPAVERTWLPCLAWTNAGRCWKPKVLALTERLLPWLASAAPDRTYQFVRRSRKNAPVQVTEIERLKVSMSFAGFDCLPSLLKVWGMYATMKNRKNDPTADRPRLFESGDEQAHAG